MSSLSLLLHEVPTILVAIRVSSCVSIHTFLFFYSFDFGAVMVLYYNDDILLNDEQFTSLCQALAENLTISNLPKHLTTFTISFITVLYFAMFLAPAFDEIKEKCLDVTDEIPDPLDLCSLFF